MCVPLCGYVNLRPEEDIRYPGDGVTGGYEPCDVGYREPNLFPSEYGRAISPVLSSYICTCMYTSRALQMFLKINKI